MPMVHDMLQQLTASNIGYGILERESWSIMGGQMIHDRVSADLQADITSSHLDYILNYILHHLQFIEEYFFGICRFDRAKLSSILVLDPGELSTRHESNI